MQILCIHFQAPSRFIKIIAATFFLSLSLHQSYATDSNIEILHWQEELVLNEAGKSSEMLIDAIAARLPQNQVLKGFILQLDPTRKINLKEVICDSRRAKFSFENNIISIQFPKPKKTGDKISIYISYDEKYKKIGRFLRQELIDIPPFAAKAKAKIIMRFPGYLDSATLNPNLTKIGHAFVYNSDNVPSEGVREIIKLTPAENSWEVNLKVTANAKKNLESAIIKTPIYFVNGGQIAKNINISSFPNSKSEKNPNENRQIFQFNKPTNSIKIENKAIIFSGAKNSAPIDRNPKNYLNFSADEFLLLDPILDEIKKNDSYKNLPLYAKIGKFVHKFIRYDINEIGKTPDIKTILRNKIGVCTEYAKLYNAIARIANIPSLIVNGAACGEDDSKCRGHSWNLIFYNNKWIHVDPTWDLMSGIVSSSHVYFNDNDVDEIKISYITKTEDSIESKIDFEMRQLDQ